MSKLQTDDRYIKSKRPALSKKGFFCLLFSWSKRTLWVHLQGNQVTTHNWPTVTETVVVGACFESQELLSSSSLFTIFLSSVDCMKTNSSFNQLLFLFFFFSSARRQKIRKKEESIYQSLKMLKFTSAYWKGLRAQRTLDMNLFLGICRTSLFFWLLNSLFGWL